MTRNVAFAMLLAGLPLALPEPVDAALVICQKGNKIKLRVDACKGKETAVDPSELGVQVGDGAVTNAKLAADARAATGSIQLLNQSTGASTMSTTPATLDRFTVDVPAPGVLHVTVAGHFWLNADATSASALTTYFYLGLCDAADSAAECGGTYDLIDYQDADDSNSTNSTHAFTRTRTVPVAAAGPRTFFVNGNVIDGAHTLNLYGCDLNSLGCDTGGPVASVVFVPGTLNVTRPAP